MAKHIHIHLTKDTKESRIQERCKDANVMTMSLSKVLQKCKNGEWEGMQDVVPNRTLQFRNCNNGRTFFVNVTHDKKTPDASPRRQALLEQIADINQKLKMSSLGGAGDKVKLKSELAELKRKLNATDASSKDANVKFIQLENELYRTVQVGRKYKIGNELVEILKKFGNQKGFNNPVVYVKVVTNNQGIIDASSKEVEALKDEIKTLEETYEKKRDQGVTVTPADIKKLVDLRNKLKQME